MHRLFVDAVWQLPPHRKIIAAVPLLHPSFQIVSAALLERALIAIEQVMARGDAAGHANDTPARQAIAMCLTSAAALVDVAQVLLRDAASHAPEALASEWQTLIGHTKTASRTAHQAVLVLSAQRDLVAAQDGVRVAGAPALPEHAH